ncbi:Metallo-dependent phosphatase [Amniculicola lignicola CBS 123094]|uniref:Metallo-dependent phosphatase n=1 Tax=Amniculicola lignicola CBS 123094 TaxID=1392246 RepID=A0A6A5WNE8_9PLEO|nr:Metallo-dependent phosphatase [Amniculicola lignicola CBS 123094]
MAQETPPTRRTRIVCISDTHNNTPRLPQGDVLIHAGDLTNQGSESELKKTLSWLEKTNFEAKIVVAGNHDMTLDAAFYAKHHTSWRWPTPQDPEKCRSMFVSSPSITYLENNAAAIYLSDPTGPHTCFTVFGSPCQPNKWTWAFQYERGHGAKVWDTIPPDADIVVTHTPPYGHCDTNTRDDRTGCEELLQALHRVRPMLAVSGHIHEGRGVERVLWNNDGPESGSLEASVELWKDPGTGKKQSLVDLSGRSRRPLENTSALTRHCTIPSLAQASPQYDSDIGSSSEPNVEAGERRHETCIINAAFMGPRTEGPKTFNKPIVVDVELPVWRVE